MLTLNQVSEKLTIDGQNYCFYNWLDWTELSDMCSDFCLIYTIYKILIYIILIFKTTHFIIKLKSTLQPTCGNDMRVNSAPAAVRQCCPSVPAGLGGQCESWAALCCTGWWGEPGEGWGTRRCRLEAPGPSVAGGAAGSR